MVNVLSKEDYKPGMVIDRSKDPPSMDDKKTPSPAQRQVWEYEADKLLGVQTPPWPTDKQRREALVKAGYASMIPAAPVTKKIKRKRMT